jgi:molecular chaperone GrpE
MSRAFKESPTPEPEREPKSGLAPGRGPTTEGEQKTGRAPGRGRETEGDSEAQLTPDADAEVADAEVLGAEVTDADVVDAEVVDAEGHVVTDGAAPGADGDDPVASSVFGDLSGLEALLSDDFARISAERDQYLDSLQRLQADFDNFRKRTERHQAELRDRANETLLAKLLPVLDALDLALAHLGLGEAPLTDEASASLVQVNTLLRDTLQREGLERIDAVGVPFDPTIHDATAMVDGSPAGRGAAEGGPEADSDDVPTGPTVAEVWRAGYRLKDRVIRPAMVRVRG